MNPDVELADVLQKLIRLLSAPRPSGKVETAVESWGVSDLPPCRVEAMSMPPGDDAEASLRAVALLTI